MNTTIQKKTAGNKKINISVLFPLSVLTILIYVLSAQMFDVCPLGKVLNPFSGAVRNEEEKDLNTTLVMTGTRGVNDSVTVFFDERKVPHIYSNNSHDIYFAQGYVSASLRLWQMDFLSYASAGRLSEIFSDKFLAYDRKQRRVGMLDAAKTTLKEIEKDSVTNQALTAYSEGVNAYIRQLNYKKMPLEYKLLDYEPEPWSKLKTVLIMKYMANTLTEYEEDFNMSNMMLALGEKNFNKLFPDFTTHITPITEDSVVGSGVADAYVKKPDYLDFSFMTSNPMIPENSYKSKLGSNSWAVSGKKTKSGHPILCSDPHLNLSLPCIWLEMQLSSPDMNVYGVSIPGTPSIIIGFNEKIAWGTTNGADDSRDWYKLQLTPDYKKYRLDGKWQELQRSVEEIKIRDRRSLLDTIYHTVQGPIVFDKSFPDPKQARLNYSLRWELQNPSNEFLAFIKLNRAKNYQDYKDAIKYYGCPTQNFTFACEDNTIAINHQGKMPVKQSGEGKFIMDGTRSSELYTKYIPEDSLPQQLNPPCNYVLSANQHPTGAGFKYYYNGYYSETRAARIRQLLQNENGFDLEKMERIQLDNVNSFAVNALPVILNNIDKNKLGQSQKENLERLSTWKGDYDFNDESAKLFELCWKYIKEYTWEKLKEYPFYSKAPEDYVLLDLIHKEPDNDYFDRRGTLEKETARDICFDAFIAASADYDALKKEESIKWGDLNKINIMHLADIRAFSTIGVSSAGNSESINAISPNWGPTWRMIVELGDRPTAFGIYPGGQSGNVGSPNYDNFIKDWNKGKYYPLLFFMSINEARAHAGNSWILKK